METFDREFEANNLKLSEERQSFENSDYEEQLFELEKEKEEAKREQEQEAQDKISQLFDNGDKKIDSVDKREKVQEFIKKNCSEPINGVDKVISFKDLVQLLIKSAESEGKEDVKKSILDGNAKDERIYELKAYKELLYSGFILPSDNRSYKNEQYHLGVDYNVKAGTRVKSMYEGKIIASGLDGGLGHRVIIEHITDDGTKFYSLYAHLGAKDLPKVGEEIKMGMKIGEVGTPFTEENGDREEHLHFQIMENVNSPKGYSKIEGEGNYDVLKSFGK